MIEKLLGFFGKKTNTQKLAGMVMKEVLVTQAVKAKVYHEYILSPDNTWIVRVYDRAVGTLIEEEKGTALSLAQAKEQAEQASLTLLQKHLGV